MGGRRRKFKEPKSGVYILGEGITEQYYFTHLKGYLGIPFTIAPRFFGNTCISDFEKKIKLLLKGDIIIICVFDVDVSNRNRIEEQRLQKLQKQYVNNKNVIFCDSNPSIEYWFLLHYSDTCPILESSKQAKTILKKYLKNYDKIEKYLRNDNWFKEMSNDKGNLHDAITRAKKYTNKKSSYSNIHKVLDKLNENTIE